MFLGGGVKDLLNSDVFRGSSYFLLVFSCSFFFLVINDGVFWDSWTLYNQSFEIILKKFTDAGFPLTAYYNYFVIDSLGVVGARIIMCAAYLLSGLFLNEILKQLNCENGADRIVIVTLFLLLPVNFSRVSVINHFAIICYLFFYAGFYFFLLQQNSKGLKKFFIRVGALLLLFFSFSLNSLLVFYVVVALAFLYRCKVGGYSFAKTFIEGVKSIDFWALPLVYYIIKSTYFFPSGIYKNYNTIDVDMLFVVIENMHSNLYLAAVDLYVIQREYLNEIGLMCTILSVLLLSIPMFFVFSLATRYKT